jgi:hypothetical protein
VSSTLRWETEQATVSNPFSISITPFKTVAVAGQRLLHIPVVLKDSGTKPISVTTSVQEVTATGNGGCGLTSPPHWISVSPGSFTLQPGQSVTTAVNVSAPASAHGQYDLAAVFRAAIPGAHGSLNLSGAVGSRVLLDLPGSTAAKPCLAVAPAVHAAAGGGSGWIGALIVAVLAGLAIFGLLRLRRVIRRWRPARAQRRAAAPALADIDAGRLAEAMKISPEQARALITAAETPPARSPAG